MQSIIHMIPKMKVYIIW